MSDYIHNGMQPRLAAKVAICNYLVDQETNLKLDPDKDLTTLSFRYSDDGWTGIFKVEGKEAILVMAYHMKDTDDFVIRIYNIDEVAAVPIVDVVPRGWK